MIIADSFIFVHIPKTGGASIRKFLLGRKELKPRLLFGVKTIGGRSYDICHLTLDELCKIQEPSISLKNKTIFMFCRNPYHRIYSSFKEYLHHSEYFFKKVPKRKYTFDQINEFIMNELTEERICNDSMYVHFKPQHLYYNKNLINDGVAGVYVGRLETFDEAFKHVCNIIKLPIPNLIPHENKSVVNQTKVALTKEAINKVNLLYQKDFEVFDYESILVG
jgi:hypothetical protein